MTAKKQPMRVIVNLDDCEWHCPCGAVHVPDQWRMEDSIAFERAHVRQHSDGYYVETISDDGMRVLSERPRSRRIPWPFHEEASS